MDAGSLLSLYSLPFKSLCYSVEFSFLTCVFVKMSQFLLRHNPDHLLSQVTYLVKELQVHIPVRNFRSIGSQPFKLSSVPGSPGRSRTRYFSEEHKTAVLMF